MKQDGHTSFTNVGVFSIAYVPEAGKKMFINCNCLTINSTNNQAKVGFKVGFEAKNNRIKKKTV